jgi:hypothetical protein
VIGLRTGIRTGLRTGLAIGIGADTLPTSDPLATVTRDGTSGIYVPANAAEWSTLIAAKSLSISAPNSLWLSQEASGNLSDSIGSLAMTAGSTPSYQQAVTGWSRKAVSLADGTGQQFTAGVGVGPNPTTTSQLWLGIIAMPSTPVSTRAFWGINTNSVSTLACRVNHNVTTGKLALQVAGVTVNSATSHSNGVHVIAVKYDRTNAAAVLYTDLNKTVGTYNSGVIDQIKGFGSAASGAEGMLYGAMWSGAAAEALTDANMKALLQAMGYTISWS